MNLTTLFAACVLGVFEQLHASERLLSWPVFVLALQQQRCSSALAKQCVSAYPQSTVTIFDLPKVVQTSREHFVSPQDTRISFSEGDFFKDALPEADLYILARILHDWTDQRNVELMTKVYPSCRPGVLDTTNKPLVFSETSDEEMSSQVSSHTTLALSYSSY
ncbi:acetylserotonin O-methyltransferase-like [Xyrauchen texanus]|uniref:acetylserotonin O-methyltransferase-like n=1 Tax=Xyrauchen texanus TaxID=154827 RepID=UPI002241CF48|nr:acetylserotonin O-methyltransferase-like [Xyrauchen texanus]